MKRVIAVLALFVLAACSQLGTALNPPPDPRFAENRSNVSALAKADAAANPDHAVADAAAVATAKGLADSAGTKSDGFAAAAGFANAIGAAQPGTPWGVIATGAAGLITAIGALVHSRNTRASIDAGPDVAAANAAAAAPPAAAKA